jgi:hypothetical protein
VIHQAREAGRAQRRLEREAGDVLHQVELHRGLQHRHLDRLPAAAALAAQQRRQDGVGDGLSGELVADHRGT